MNAQTSLPGCAATSTANRAALEQDLRGEVALAIMALLTWVQFHGGATPLLDGTVDRWLCAGRPHDPQIVRALINTRAALARYVAGGGDVPEWFPPSVLKALQDVDAAKSVGRRP